MTDDASRFPIDLDTLSKGDAIPVDVMEDYADAKAGTGKYRLAGMKLASWIEMSMQAKGTPMFTRWEGDTLQVMTDEEAVDRLHARILALGGDPSRGQDEGSAAIGQL
jgi:hypothetical protein